MSLVRKVSKSELDARPDFPHSLDLDRRAVHSRADECQGKLDPYLD